MLRRKVNPGQAGLRGGYYNFFPLYYSFLLHFRILNDEQFIVAALSPCAVPSH